MPEHTISKMEFSEEHAEDIQQGPAVICQIDAHRHALQHAGEEPELSYGGDLQLGILGAAQGQHDQQQEGQEGAAG